MPKKRIWLWKLLACSSYLLLLFGGGVCTRFGGLCVSWHTWKSLDDNFRELVLSSRIYAGSRDQTHVTVLREQVLLPLSYSIGTSCSFLLLSIAFLSPQGRSKCCDVSSLARLGFSLVLHPFLSMMIVCIVYSQSCCTNSLICLRQHHTAHGNHISA